MSAVMDLHFSFGNTLWNHHEVYYEVKGFYDKAYCIVFVLLPQPCTEAPETMRQNTLSLRYFLIRARELNNTIEDEKPQLTIQTTQEKQIVAWYEDF